MFSTTCKRPLAAVAVAAGLLVAAAPASATLQSFLPVHEGGEHRQRRAGRLARALRPAPRRQL